MNRNGYFYVIIEVNNNITEGPLAFGLSRTIYVTKDNRITKSYSTSVHNLSGSLHYVVG